MTKPPVGPSIAILLGIALAVASAFDGSATSVRAGMRGVSNDEIPEPSAKDEWCDESQSHNWNGKSVGHCEVRETRLAAAKRLIVDAGMNGSIQVKGWKQKDVLVLAKVQTWGKSEADARELAQQVKVETDQAKIRTTGPERSGTEGPWWGVSLRIYTPNVTDLDLEAFNGGIRIEGVSGAIDLETLNGAVGLKRVSGNVSGRTTNGALAVALDGDHWQGSGLDLQTTNGAVNLVIPVGYNATLETGTTNGQMDIGIEGRYTDRQGRRFRAELGKGGAPIRLMTTNGRVYVATDPGD